MFHATFRPRTLRAEVRRRTALLLAAFVLLLGLFAAGALGRPAPAPVALTAPDTLLHEQWTVEDGLPVNHGNALYQTPDGYLWLATFDGLVRFDGLTFTVYNASNTPALPSSRIRTIRPGHGASFWMTTEQGDLVRQTSGARLETFGVHAEYLYTTYLDGDSLTWLASRGGLFRYRDGQVSSVFEDQLDRLWVTDVRRDAGGTLWVGTNSENGVWRATGSRLARVRPDEAPNIVTSLTAVYRRDRTGYCPDGTHSYALGGSISRAGQTIASTSSRITDILCDRAGDIWITTRTEGLHRYSRQPLRTYSEQEGLGDRNVYSVYEDPAGARWFTGRGGRISRLQDGVFRHYTGGTHFAQSKGPTIYDSDQAMYEDRDGTLWLGFQVCRAVDRTAAGRCARFDWAAGAPQKNGVYAIHQTTNGARWFGTTDGLHRLHEGRWTRFTTADGLADDHVRYLLETQDGTLYAATLRGGVLRYRDGQFSAITKADGLPSNHVRALYEDNDGFVWIGTEDRGLARYDPSTGALATIRQADGLYYDGLHQILEDDAGRLWMSTNRGLFWVRRAALNAFIRGETEHVTSVHYTERDGMRNREANGGRQQSALKASDGQLWFATQNGAVVVDPADVLRDAPSPQPIIGRVMTDGTPVATPQAGGSLALAAEDRSFTVAYTAPAFSAPERVRFRYRLEGFDDGWIEAGPRREAIYTKVPPGRYTFRVAALRPGGEWTEDAAPLRLTVAPFFYETWWFLGLCGGVFGLALLGGYRARTRHLRRRQEQLQVRVDEQTRALRAEKDELRQEKQKTEQQAERLREMDRLKSRFFTNVSHEFRTPLTLTIGPLEDLQADEAPALPSVAQEKVDLALRNSRRLLRLIGQLLDVAKLEAGAMRLDPERADLAVFVRRLARTFVPLAERRRMRFTLEAPAGPLPARFDADRMEQVLANLLSNAFKFTPEGGAVHVSVSTEAAGASDIARVTVRDSGPGIPPDELPRLFERFYQARETAAEVQPSTGIGLSLAKDLAELHGGTLTVESTVGVGTTFTVRWPRGTGAPASAPAAPRTTTLLAAAARANGAPPSGDGAAGDAAAPPDEAPAPSEASEEDRPTLLIADDNAEIRAYVRSHFAPRYRVLEAADGRAALDTARTRLPDCIVSDVMMPRLDGFELVQALQTGPATDFLPVLLLTARATDADTIEGLSKGADAYLTKPFNMRELQVRVEALIASRQRLKERFATAPPPSAAPAPSLLPDDVSASEAAYLECAQAVVEANLHDEDFGVEALAAALDQSRSTVYRRLRDLLDQSPTAFIRTSRLARGAALLREERGTVSEVAYAVGFKSVSHFSQCFREQFDVSPSVYRDTQFAEASSAAEA